MFWLGGGVVGDDTHGHVDDVCRFVNPTTVVLVKELRRSDRNYRPLATNWERIRDLRLEDGSKPEVVALPMPAPLSFEGTRLPASYANFYIGTKRSSCRRSMTRTTAPRSRCWRRCSRPAAWWGIHAVDLVWGFGTLHCMTQQQPA